MRDGYMTALTEAADVAGGEVNLLRVWFRFIRMERRLFAAIGLRLREIGLSIPQFDLLSTLTEREGITQQELAERLYVTKGNVSGLVDRLVAGELVERRTLAGDRRSHALFLTAKGRALAEQGIAIQSAYVTETLGLLPDRDLLELERIIQSWRDILRQQDQRAAARR